MVMIPVYFLLTLVVFYLTFVFFCALMKLRAVRDNGYLKDAPEIVRMFAYLTLALGLLLDALLNLLLSAVFMELPREFLTTYRVIRLKKSGTPWQKSCANWLCRQLDALDEHHCND